MMAKILVIDDIEDNILLLTFNLEDDGHQVIAARSGQDGYHKALSELPDLILLDMMMPVWDGIKTLKELKKNLTTADIPVIMVSANDTDTTIIEALDIGAHDYIAKPYIYEVLAARLRSALRLKKAQDDLEQANITLANLASLDPLTEVYNRRHFYTLAKAEYSRARRHKRPLVILMLDVDFFKRINDKYGHAIGDQVLISLTQLCRKIIRQSDILARFGGEEFVICCPDTTLEDGCQLSKRLCMELRNSGLSIPGQAIDVTASIGVAAMNPADICLEDIINRADTLLYDAKNSGRDRVACQA